MTQKNVKKSVADAVTRHTLLAAYSTLDCHGVPPAILTTLKKDLAALNQLDNCPLVGAAIELVTIGLAHAAGPTTVTYDAARIARDKLGGLMINARSIKG